MVREIRKEPYIIALFITALIFVTGFLLGYAITNPRIAELREVSSLQAIEQRSLQLESFYLSNLKEKNESCQIFNSILASSLNTVREAQSRLEIYIEQGNPSRYENIKREYMLTEINYWLIYDSIKETCKQDNVAILYFYSNENCPDCQAQGTVLTYFKNKLEDRLLVFSLDYDFTQEPMIGLLKKGYNITSTPSIVVKDTNYDGLVSRDKLLGILCQLYISKPTICYE